MNEWNIEDFVLSRCLWCCNNITFVIFFLGHFVTSRHLYIGSGSWLNISFLAVSPFSDEA